MNKTIAKSIYFWGSKPLGLKCLKYLTRVCRARNLRLEGFSFYDTAETKFSKDWIEINKYFSGNKKNIKTRHCDFGFCIGFPKKIDVKTIKKVKNGIINLHFGPLPYSRGSAILNHSIANKEKKFGLTLHYIDEGLDTGPIIKIKWYRIPRDKLLSEILKELEEVGFGLFREYLDKTLNLGKLKSIPQEHFIRRFKIQPKFYTRRSLDDLYRIDNAQSFEDIYRRLRALPINRSKLPYLEKQGKRIYLSINNS